MVLSINYCQRNAEKQISQFRLIDVKYAWEDRNTDRNTMNIINIKWTIEETGNIGYTRRRQSKQKHNTICGGHHYSQTNTNNVNKT